VSLGLDPLPNSVTAKLATAGGADGSFPAKVAGKLVFNMTKPGGLFLGGLAVALAVASVVPRENVPRVGLFGFAIAAAGLAHLAFGSIGWMDRYEIYAIVAVTAALILVLSTSYFLVRWIALAVVFAAGLFVYLPNALGTYTWNPAAIRLQHGEMGRFAKMHLRAPVAVNDLGFVAWRNDFYVLDLWGLASADALRTRLSDPESGWADTLTEQRGVSLAMIYDTWLESAIGTDWVKLGDLQLYGVPRAFLGSDWVGFYATSPKDVAPILAKVRIWADDLPEGVRFEFVRGLE
jgi:hypothetical protein